MYESTTDKPVHHLTVANARGEVIGYLWANDEDDAADSQLRPAGDSSAYEECHGYWLKLEGAKARGLAPTAALAELAQDSDPRRVSHIVPGSLSTSQSLAALRELASVVTEADDRRLLAQLDRTNAQAWHELAQGLAELTDEDREVQWVGGGQQPNGTWRVSHPQYSERLMRIVRGLDSVGAVTPAYLWTENPPPTLPPHGRLRPADAVRAATTIVRGERLCDGTIAEAVRSGLLNATVESLRTWYETEGTAPPQPGAPLGCTANSPMPYVPRTTTHATDH